MNANKALIALTAALVLHTTAALAVVITTNTTIAIGVTTYDGQDIVVSNCTLTVNGPHPFTSLLVTSNGVVTHTADPVGTTSNRLELTILTDATVALGGAIQADGRGYGAGQGPGAGRTGCPYNCCGGGGGHGGLGGMGNSYGQIAGGTNYGSILQPTDFGSGGGGGGAGGGAIRMTVAGTLTVNGQILANGSPSSSSYGGGSGGSIWLTVGTLSGTGGIAVNGAAGGHYDINSGGGGGGGRIALYYQTSSFAGVVSAIGGFGFFEQGGAGTIYTKAASLNTGDLLVDNGGTNGAMTLLTSPVAFNVTITNAAVVYSATPLLFNNLNVAAGGTVTHLPALLGVQITCLSNLTIQAGAVIQANGRGYGADQGPGAGRTGCPYNCCGGGGGHGGLGGRGDSYGQIAGGTNYDSILQPTDFGSGGGRGGAGGGAIRMTVAGTLTVNGQILANGSPGSTQGDGGGSGGSIWLTVGTLSGTGGIAANGAAGGHYIIDSGGGGGGGRIALYYQTSSFAGVVSAIGGFGFFEQGGAGTIYTKAASLNTGDLLVDNGGTNGAMTLLTSPVAFNVTITNAAVVYSATPLLFNNLNVAAGGTVTHLPALLGVQITCLSNLTIQAGAVIQANGLGYGGGQGPGAGQTGCPYNCCGGGGGYGGLGGSGASIYGAYYVAGGTSYGSILQPTDFGSGGGWGGAGGGAIRMTVAGTLTVNGQILANGLSGSSSSASGGGSGGSIWLTVGTLSGTGGIAVNGAAGGNYYSDSGGGGGGGRIAIYTGVNEFAGTVAASGGQGGHQNGFSGSLYYSTNVPPPMVIAQYPGDSANRFVSYVDVTFNQPVDPATFTTNDLVLTAPSGPIPLSQITLTGGGGVTWRIGFPMQSANGAYSFTVGPHIANLFGQEMAASYSGGFTLNFTTPTATVRQTGGNLSLIWSSATGLSYQLQSTTNLTAASWLNEGAPLNGTGGLLTNSLPIGAQPGKFFRFLILEN